LRQAEWSLELAKRGWQVTGVDVVPKAILIARDRARASGVEAQFVHGDITDPGAAALEPAANPETAERVG